MSKPELTKMEIMSSETYKDISDYRKIHRFQDKALESLIKHALSVNSKWGFHTVLDMIASEYDDAIEDKSILETLKCYYIFDKEGQLTISYDTKQGIEQNPNVTIDVEISFNDDIKQIDFNDILLTVFYELTDNIDDYMN